LSLIDGLLARGDLGNYHLAHAARADLCRRLGRTAEARAAYERALVLTRQETERRFLQRRLAELQDSPRPRQPAGAACPAAARPAAAPGAAATAAGRHPRSHERHASSH